MSKKYEAFGTVGLDDIEQRFYNHIVNKLTLYNASSQPCDVLWEGFCCCGAYHAREDFIDRCSIKTWRQVVKDCQKNGVVVPQILLPRCKSPEEHKLYSAMQVECPCSPFFRSVK